MNKPILIHNGRIYVRINKQQAKDLYDNNVTITLYPCNYSEDFYHELCVTHFTKKNTEAEFSEVVKWYESEYCYDNDTGRKANFYVATEYLV